MYKVVIVGRNKKKRIVYNSGLIHLQEKSSVEYFLEEAKERGLEAYEVKTTHPLYTPEESGKGYFCPYCGNWEYWTNTGDYRRCPICGISDHEYYVRKVNNLWTISMGTKKAQKMKVKGRRSK